jgi:hypothetical protein
MDYTSEDSTAKASVVDIGFPLGGEVDAFEIISFDVQDASIG